MTSEPSEQCLAYIHRGSADLQQGNLDAAERHFGIAVQAARALSKEHAYSLFPLTLSYLSLLRIRQGKTDEAARLRTAALSALDTIKNPLWDAGFQTLMGEALMQLQEYRRAIPFYERALQLVSRSNDSLAVAALMSDAGQCYSRSGLLDQAAVPLRAAVRIFRDHPGDPRLPEALLNLGNALRKSSPAEAEQLYKESAAFYENGLQMDAATSAWVNLGVLCSSQARYVESLFFYRKALRVRERSARTSPARLGTLLINIANCQRRMGEYAEAHTLVDRAIHLLQPGAPELASAFSIRGLILHDQGRAGDAFEWLQKASAERQKAPVRSLEDGTHDHLDVNPSSKRLDHGHVAQPSGESYSDIHPDPDALTLLRTDSHLAHTRPDMPSQMVHSEGAVLVELDCGNRWESPHSLDDAVKLAMRLSEAMESQLGGFYGGRVMIPASMTLMFYGADGESLFRAMESALWSEPLCVGARVAIRQGSQLREVGMPTRVM